jgi:di/tricarboxylate transporter
MTEQRSPSHNPLAEKVTGPNSSSILKKRILQVLNNRIWHIVIIVVAAISTGGVAVQFVSIDMAVVAALTVFCIGLWATAAVPEYWPALAFFLIAVVFEIAPAEVVFSGFHSSTFWLLFSGMVIGVAIRHTGLGRRAAGLLSRMLGLRYNRVILGIVVFSVLLAFVMPSSMGRIVLLITIIVDLAYHLGYSSASNCRVGMLTAAAFGTWLPAFAILPSNAPNMILAGMAENLYAHEVSYWDYLLLHFPVLGLIKAGCLVLLIVWMFPDSDPVNKKSYKNDNATMSTTQTHLVALLGACLVFWLSDGVHHISPGWIGLAAALYCLWPYSNLTSKSCLDKDIKYGSLFFVAGIMGLGAAISSTGLGEVMVQSLSGYAGFSNDRPLWNVIALTAISTLVALLASLPSVPAVMSPLSDNLASITGLPLGTVLMTQVLAFSNVLLPYQAPPLIMAMQLGNLPLGAMSKLCIALFVCSTVILIPLDLLWWRFLGLF